MKLYQFKTRTTSYYFPKLTTESTFIYSLYGNYGGKIAHLLWWLFTHSASYRGLNNVDSDTIPEMNSVEALLGNDVVYGVNLGTPGPDQKKSILGYDANRRFFAKFASKERAMALSRNEIKVYQTLAETGLVPKLYDYNDTAEYVYLKCECISGEHVHEADRKQVMEILEKMRGLHYAEGEELQAISDGYNGLKTCFAHHDFCPWNMIDVDGKLHVIDWEMATELVWGYDLFTFLLQTEFLVGTGLSGLQVVEKERAWIDEYFEGLDWKPYIKAFVEDKVNFFSVGQNDLLLSKYSELQKALT